MINIYKYFSNGLMKAVVNMIKLINNIRKVIIKY